MELKKNHNNTLCWMSTGTYRCLWTSDILICIKKKMNWTAKPGALFTISKEYFKNGNKKHQFKYTVELEDVNQKRVFCFSTFGYTIDIIFSL